MNTTTQRVQKAYSNWADMYDTNINRTRDLNADVLRQASLPVAGKKVLEIGCGTGINTEYLAGYAKQVTGFDISEEMISHARKKISAQHVRFVTGDITRPWPFEAHSYDFISANLVLEHIENLNPIFEEASRVLTNGGDFYISELHPYKQLQNSQARYTDKETGEEVLVDAFVHTVSEYVNAGISAGFTLLKMGEFQHEMDEIPRLLTLHFKKVLR